MANHFFSFHRFRLVKLICIQQEKNRMNEIKIYIKIDAWILQEPQESNVILEKRIEQKKVFGWLCKEAPRASI